MPGAASPPSPPARPPAGWPPAARVGAEVRAAAAVGQGRGGSPGGEAALRGRERLGRGSRRRAVIQIKCAVARLRAGSGAIGILLRGRSGKFAFLRLRFCIPVPSSHLCFLCLAFGLDSFFLFFFFFPFHDYVLFIPSEDGNETPGFQDTYLWGAAQR